MSQQSQDGVEEAAVVIEGSNEESEVLGFLQANSLFAPVRPSDLSSFARTGRYRWISPGEAVVREGELGSTFYIVKNGSVLVTTLQNGSEVVELATLGPGAFFGEVSVLKHVPRTATVVAKNDVEVYEFRQDEALNLLEQYPDFRANLDALILKRSRDTIHKLGYDT